jgi:uncharacterized membrane protein
MSSIADRLRTATGSFVARFPWKPVLGIFGFVLLVAWLQFTPEGLLGKADAVGYAVCHRIDGRSFHLGDRQIAVCARCTGQYLGAVLSLMFLSILRPRRTGRPNWGIIGILILFAGAYALDGVNSYLHLLPGLERFYLYEPNNTLRLISGTALGMGIGVMLYPAFNETVWKRRDPRPVLAGFMDFGGLLGLGAIIVLLVRTENPLVLYPLALISAAGVLVLLTIVYTMVTLMVFKAENRCERAAHLFFPLLAGFVVALMQIAVLDYIRFLFTNTWDGFHFG